MKLSNITYPHTVYVFQGHLSLCHQKAIKSFHNNIHVYYNRPHISRCLRNDAALSEKLPTVHYITVHYTPVRTLRSANKNLLFLPELFYPRAFSRAAPTVWNALPSSVTSVNTFPLFKKAFNTHLFQLAHDT